MSQLQVFVSSKEIAFGKDFKWVDADGLKDFVDNAFIGQKYWNQDEELMYYKTHDPEINETFVFYLINGKAHIYQYCNIPYKSKYLENFIENKLGIDTKHLK